MSFGRLAPWPVRLCAQVYRGPSPFALLPPLAACRGIRRHVLRCVRSAWCAAMCCAARCPPRCAWSWAARAARWPRRAGRSGAPYAWPAGCCRAEGRPKLRALALDLAARWPLTGQRGELCALPPGRASRRPTQALTLRCRSITYRACCRRRRSPRNFGMDDYNEALLTQYHAPC